MATLLDAIRRNMQQAPQQQAPAAVGATQAAARLQQARGGKQVGATEGPQMSTVAEQVGIQQAQQGLQDVGQQAAIQSEQLAQRGAEQEQREQLAGAQIQQGRQINREQAAQEERNLISAFERERAGMSEEDRQAKMEQIGFVAALQDDEYMNKLQMEGARRRLDNDAEFRVALRQQFLTDMEDILRDDLQFRDLESLKQNDWERGMAKMDYGTAIKLAQRMIDDAANEQFWSGIQGTVVSGASAYGQYKADKTKSSSGAPNPNASQWEW
jgi:hypothetical protein